MFRLKLYPFHTFLFIPFIVFFLYAHNLGQTKAYMTVRTLWVGLLASVVLFALLYGLLRNRLKTGVLVTFMLFALFQYGVIYEFFESLYYAGKWPLNNIHRYLISLYAILLIVFTWLTKRTKHDFIKINYFLNALILLLLLFNAITILFSHYSAKDLEITTQIEHRGKIVFDPKKPRPDIYYIILDGYASNAVLDKYYNFKNTEFSGSLKRKGFTICDSAFSNYYYTSGSLAGTLNFNYPNDSLSQADLIGDNLLFRTLKDNSYRIWHIKSGYAVTSFFKLADKTIRINGPNEFEKSLFKYTILRLDDLVGLFAYTRLNSQFEKMMEFVSPPGEPRFCFMHFVAPHPPYIFDRKGNIRTKHQFAEHSWEPKEYYVDQLVYVNSQIDKLITRIIGANPNAVIVLQSDHGPWIKATTRDEVFEARSKVLYAYYMPEKPAIPCKTSSVNTFRYLLNHLFNCGLDTLPDLAAGKEKLMEDPILVKKAEM